MRAWPTHEKQFSSASPTLHSSQGLHNSRINEPRKSNMGVAHASNYILWPFMPPAAACKFRQVRRKQQPQKSLHTAALCTQRPPRPPTQRPRRRPPTAAKQSTQPMPRCSSFASTSTLQSTRSKRATNDPNYAHWKSSFEELHSPCTPQAERARIHDISEALSGQLTPKGFPSYSAVTKTHVSPITTTTTSKAIDAKSAVGGTKVRRRLSLRLPFNNCKDSPKLTETKKACKSNNTAQKSQSHAAAHTKPFAASKPLFIAKLPQPQAKVVERLYEEIRDWQDYYGTRLDYYYL